MIGFFKSVREDVAAVFENDPAVRWSPNEAGRSANC